MTKSLQPEMVATIVFGIFMALLAILALVQVARYATRAHCEHLSPVTHPESHKLIACLVLNDQGRPLDLEAMTVSASSASEVPDTMPAASVES